MAVKSDASKLAAEDFSPKTAKMLGLFLAAVLVLTPGCGSNETERAGHTHIDRNNDGYCDEDGEPMPAAGSSSRHYGNSGGYYGGYYSLPHYGGGTTTVQPSGPSHPAGISSGSAPHGGIGSSHTGGGG
jgi:hypothetical protein